MHACTSAHTDTQTLHTATIPDWFSISVGSMQISMGHVSSQGWGNREQTSECIKHYPPENPNLYKPTKKVCLAVNS